MEELPDWKHRGHHIETRANRKNPNETNILVGWANEAGFLITVRDENGHLWGATAFRSSSYDQSAYTREES